METSAGFSEGLSISRETLLSELKLIEGSIHKWVAQIEERGLPFLDFPGSAEQLFGVVKELRGELLLNSGKLDTLAGVLGEDLKLG